MLRIAVAGFLVVLLAAACDGDSSSQSTPGPGATSTSDRPAAEASEGPTPGRDAIQPLGGVGLVRVFGDLTFQQATGMYQGPAGRFFVTEQPGRVRVFSDSPGGPASEVFLDITDRTNASGFEEGLLGFALAPDFAQSGDFYVNYTAANPRRTVVSRFSANVSENVADAASEVVLLEVDQPFSNHNGGQIAFGPDGHLYIAFGDGGGGGDSMGNGQNLDTLLGKILRISVEAADENQPYSIPADNPFAGQSATESRAEIWAFGLRNPWRFSFDPQTGRLFAGDVGAGAREEIDLIVRGGNSGWNLMEGSECFSNRDCDHTGLILPVIDYAAAGSDCAVIGGHFYRGQTIADLEDAYVYGDFCSGRIWALRLDGTEVTESKLVASLEGQLSSFATDTDGEIYVLAYGETGFIFKLAPLD